jgi:hypothetical protein
MAITLISTVATVLGSSGGTTSAIDTTGATGIVLHVASYDSSAIAVSDAKSNSYTGLTIHATSSPCSQLFYTVTPTVGTGHTFTVSGSGIYAAIVVYAFAGVASYGGQENGALHSGDGPFAVGSVTPSVNGALIVTGLAGDQPTTDTYPSGFTGGVTLPYGGGSNFQNSAAYLIQGTAAAVNPSWTWTPSGHPLTAGAVAVFHPAAAVAHATTQVVWVLV